MPIVEFRKECREFAEHWIGVHKSEFKRLGVVGDWYHPYTTMAYPAEAGIFRELAKFLLSGELYRGKKSVMWSVVEKTALAEAEVEYRDHTSTTIIVRFPVVETPRPELAGASVLIWTTTPWTIPGNRAVAYGDDVSYRVIEVTEIGARSLAMGLCAVNHPKLCAWSNAILVVSPDHYAIFREGGWGRREIEAGLREALRRPGKDLVRGAHGVEEGIDPELAEQMVDKFSDGGLLVVRAGGRGGLMSAVIGGWSAQRRKSEVQTVSREIPR